MSDRRQLELPTESGSLAFRIAADCPKCSKPLKLTQLPGTSYLECLDLKCGFVEPRDAILARLMETLLRQRSKIAELGGGIV